MIRKIGLPTVVEMTDSSTTCDLKSELTDRSMDTNMLNMEYKRKYEELLYEKK